jgi:solute carrier family 25 protein 33/36
VRNEGVKALFKGLGPNIVGVAPYRAIYFFSYANSKNLLSSHLGSDKPLMHVMSAFMAGFTAVSITNPIWFVKTRMQLDQSRRGLTALTCARKILKEKGVLGFYKGITASYFGICESAMYFVIYEHLKKISASNLTDSSHNLTMLSYFTSAGFAKSLASCICYPHGNHFP